MIVSILPWAKAFKTPCASKQKNARPSLPRHRLWVDDQLPAKATADPEHPYEAWLASQRADERDEVVPRSAVQMLLHSSGTTGLPKGIIYTHATTLASSMAKIIDFGLATTDIVVVFGPLFHAGPLMDLAIPLLLLMVNYIMTCGVWFSPKLLYN